MKRFKISRKCIEAMKETSKLQNAFEKLMTAQSRLDESEQRYQSLIDNMSDLVWITDRKGIVTFINDEVENILGYKKEALLNKPLYQVMCPLHKYENCSDIITEMNNQDFIGQELWMLCSDRRTRKVIETNTKRLYKDSKLIGVQGVGRDATERIKMEENLKRKNKQLTMLNEISSTIDSNKISVDLKTLFDNITKKIVDTIDIPLCSIRLFDEEIGMVCVSAAGPLAEYIDLPPIKINKEDFFKHTKETPLHDFSRICKDYILATDMHSSIRDSLEKLLFIPLSVNGNPIGILSLFCSEVLDDEYQDMLGSIANNIAFAVEKQELYASIKQSYLKTIKSLVVAIEAKDPYTQGHSIRVSQYAMSIAKELGLSAEEIDEIEIAGILHDIGKIGINDEILTKPGLLEPQEYDAIKEHPVIGCRILKPIGLSDNIINATLLHHKRYDLTGYPAEPQISELPLYASIICAADAFDAMTSNRSYKLPMTNAHAINELKRNSGTQFCPSIVDIMIRLYESNKL